MSHFLYKIEDLEDILCYLVEFDVLSGSEGALSNKSECSLTTKCHTARLP